MTDTDLVYATFPITKWEATEDGKGIYVYGKATDGSVDSDRQIVDSEWSASALQKWMSSGPNVRLMHNPKLLPAGSGVQLEVNRDGDGGHWVKSKIDEPNAVHLVKNGHLRAYSVGIAHPVIERDITGKAPGGIIKGNDHTEICELSLVDRPANSACGITLVKSETGTVADEVWTYGDLEELLKRKAPAPEFIGKAYGSVEGLSRTAFKAARAEWLADEPSAQGSHTGTDYLAARAAWQKWNTTGDEQNLSADDDETFTAWVAKRQMDPDVGGGVDRDKIPAEDFAGKDRSFPIVTPKDVADAARSVGRAGSDNYSPDELKSRIIAIAKRKGDSYVAQLPEAWKNVVPDVEKAAEETEKAKKPFPGAKPAFGKEDADGKDSDGDGSDVDEDEDDDDSDSKASEPAATKGMKDCTGCGKTYHADAKVKKCENCGKKLPVAKGSESVTLTVAEVAELLVLAGIGKKKKRMVPPTTKPAGTHREPDGTSTVEQLEPDAGMATDPDKTPDKVPAAVGKGYTPDYATIRMHDALCSAYTEHGVKAAYPSLDTIADAINPEFWRNAEAEADRAGKAKRTARMHSLVEYAEAVKAAEPALLADARAELSKMFMDSYPNVHMTPGEPPTPGRFERPFISSGHASMTPGSVARIPSGTHVPSPDQFDRGLITEGHEAASPGDTGQSNPTPTVGSTAARTFYTSAGRTAARNAMQAMHDHISNTFPDMCPLAASKNVLPADMNAKNTPAPRAVADALKAPGEKAAAPEGTKALAAEDIASVRSEYEEIISKMQKQIDELGSEPDPTQAPVRGAVRFAPSGSPVEKSAQTPSLTPKQIEDIQFAMYVAKNAVDSGSPEDRERGMAVLEKLLKTT